MDKNVLLNKKILSVEDDELFLDSLSAKFAGLGCNFIPAKNSTEVFKVLEKEKPDIIILDMMLPGGMDGFAILKKIKSDKEFKNIPVIILSNLTDAMEVQMGMKLGAFMYLTKSSVTLDEVVDNVKSVLSSKKI